MRKTAEPSGSQRGSSMGSVAPGRRTPALLVGLCLLLSGTSSVPAVQKSRLSLHYHSVDLPGVPSAIVPADVDGDGLEDLTIVVTYTEWDQIAVDDWVTMDDVEGLVEVMTIVPALFDRRELLILLGRGGGRYEPAAEPWPLDESVLSIEAGPPGVPVMALTEEGLAAVGLVQTNGEIELSMTPVLSERPVLAGTGVFLPALDLVHDVDADGVDDVLFPAADRMAIYLSGAEGLRPAGRVPLPGDDLDAGRELVRRYPLPRVEDVSGDGLPDLVVPHHDKMWAEFWVLVNGGDGEFSQPIEPLRSSPERALRDGGGVRMAPVVHFGDLDGDGLAEFVTQEDMSAEDAGWRKELKEAKRPPFLFRLHRARSDLSMDPVPYEEFRALGYAFEGDDEIQLPGGFQDLDGDGRQDLVTLTLGFSVLQAVRILTTHSISVALDFHVWCQDASGKFEPVKDLDLSGKFRIDLDNMRLGRLSQFAGDFDGDGRADFVQLGRGRQVTIHRGREGCTYPVQPDLEIELREEPKNLALVRIEDFDGDGLTDLLVVQPQPGRESTSTLPVRLDLYLSEGGS